MQTHTRRIIFPYHPSSIYQQMHENRFSIIAAINGKSIISHAQHRTNLSQELKTKAKTQIQNIRNNKKIKPESQQRKNSEPPGNHYSESHAWV